MIIKGQFRKFFYRVIFLVFDFHLVGVIWIGRWAGDRKERITEVTS